MTTKLLKLLLGILILAGELDSGKSYMSRDIVEAAESYCKEFLEKE
jgi:hypothetical protein